ncbi:MAG: methionine--tRNA ligase [Patescibacteria group bacterium]
MSEKFYVTTSIAYVNAPPHIGFALELIYADAVARYHRFAGKQVIFTTGTDDHGQKIARKAEAAGQTPQQFADEMSATFRESARRLGISNTDFIRTTEPRHAKAVEKFWRRVQAAGHIEKKAYVGLYCVGCEEFKTEKDLVDGKCPIHDTLPERVEEENYFFKLTSFADKLKDLYAARTDFVVPNSRSNEVEQLLKDGLEDVSISRSRKQLNWGIAVPDDDTQVIYVWFDALVNYLTALGFPDEKNLAKLWPADLHIIGKDINRFHTILWPAMLMAAGLEVPRQVGVHGWIHSEGKKMSKSLGNVVTPDELIRDFGVEGTRYLLLHEVPFRGDGDYTKEKFIERYNSNLANNLGNLVNRVCSMTWKYLEGSVPAKTAEPEGIGAAWHEYHQAMRTLEFDTALAAIWKLVDGANQLVDHSKPWVLAKEGKTPELAQTMYQLLETIRHVAWMLAPLLPGSAKNILEQLGSDAAEGSWEKLAAWGGLEEGSKIGQAVPLFPRLEIK